MAGFIIQVNKGDNDVLLVCLRTIIDLSVTRPADFFLIGGMFTHSGSGDSTFIRSLAAPWGIIYGR